MCNNSEVKMEDEKTQMRCPKCSEENSQGARFCCSCGSALTRAEATDQSISVRVSTIALVACIGALCGLALVVPILIAVTRPKSLQPRWEWAGVAFVIGMVVLGVTAILGLISIVRIERSGGRITGRPFAIGAILIAIVGSILLPVWSAVGLVPRSTAYRMVCGTNLSGIGKAMLIYSNDYDDQLPRAGGKNSTWAQGIPDWTATNRFEAYGVSPTGEGGVGAISSCYYLLVKYSEVQPKHLLCSSEPRAKPFEPAKYGARGRDLTDLWDFGPEPWKHYSFSYHMPYGEYALTTSYLPGVAVAADRNPWMASPFIKARTDFDKFNPDGDRKAVKAGNTVGHHGDGQNVLFLDSHVSFEKYSFCGVNDDNIYTYWDGPDIRRGARPVLGSEPKDGLDSLLVHDPPPTNPK